ncbi:MAG TPA: hypothetical protein PK264_08745 [Hyphomicrobiaceae bacterium]|nr:hypothetical protein [Hyphomicrobiaceae bacterium]
MSTDRLSAIAAKLVAARTAGARITLVDAPKTFEEGFAVQDKVVAALGSPVMGWKVIEMPNGGPVIYAPLLESGRVPAGGTWSVKGSEPAGIELEIAFRMARDVPKGATGSSVLDCVGAGHVVFELCQSRNANPDSVPRHVAVADCILNSGIMVGPEIANWRKQEHKSRPGRLFVDGKVHIEGKSVDPFRALEVLAPALAAHGKQLKAGQIVITGSLIGMNWLHGSHDIRGVIDGFGEVQGRVARA